VTGGAANLAAFWAKAVKQGRWTPLLGERFASARREMEWRWGCQNYELPISRLCRTEAFASSPAICSSSCRASTRFTNDSVRDYRRRYGLRSPNHPVPDLARDGDWFEAPFWMWRAGAKQRGD